MGTAKPKSRPVLRVLTSGEAEKELLELSSEADYEALRLKAETDSLTPTERAAFRRMEGLRFVLKLSA